MKGILFKPDMIQAIIEGRKTQTRRVIKQLSPEYEWEVVDVGEPILMFKDGVGGCIFLQPRYHIGETVYVKEAYWFYRRFGTMANIKYMRDGFVTWVPIPRDKPTPKTGYHSPLMMPERVARRFIMIEQVRAERVQGISSGDCLAEGITASADDGIGQQGMELDYKFSQLWDSINPKYPWESNPWVFPYTFSLKEVQ